MGIPISEYQAHERRYQELLKKRSDKTITREEELELKQIYRDLFDVEAANKKQAAQKIKKRLGKVVKIDGQGNVVKSGQYMSARAKRRLQKRLNGLKLI